MDESNKQFNPADEYESIEVEFPDTLKSQPNKANDEYKDVSDTDDVFEAFEKAQREYEAENYKKDSQNEQPPASNAPINHQTGQGYAPFNNMPTPPPMGQPYYPPYPYPQYPPHYVNGVPKAPESFDFNPYKNPYTPNMDASQSSTKLPTKAKVFIGIMVFLLAFFISAFFFSLSILPKNSDTQAIDENHPLAFLLEETVEPTATTDDSSTVTAYAFETVEYEITLQADKGETQKSTDDKDENSYPPNEDAKEIKAKDLPKDKDDKKYNTKSAYNAVTDSVVSIECYDKASDSESIVGEGTGTIISSDGYIITNSHVIANSKQYSINVTLNNSKTYMAKVVGFDSRTDLAVIKIDEKDLPKVTFGKSEDIEVGQDIVAIGNPGGSSFQNSLTKGIVSAVDRELDLNANVKFIQIDAAINPGNSGGPLCNIYGQVIGINTAKISDTSYEGMGFAIPTKTALEIANDIIKYGYVKDRVRLGLVGMEVTAELAYYYGLPSGIIITDIEKGGPIDNSGIAVLDIVTKVNGKSVESFQDIYSELEKYSDGDKIKITVYRLKP